MADALMPLAGTRVVHALWQEHHAPVPGGAMLSTCTITRAGSGSGTWDEELQQTVPPARTTVLASGRCRVQALTRDPARSLVEGQEVTLGDYLVVVEAVVSAEVEDRILIEACPNDAELVGAAFVVASVTVGSLVWERDLYCTAEQG